MTHSVQKKTSTTPTTIRKTNPLYLFFVPGDVSGIFNEHFDCGGTQQPQHGQQADVLPQVLVDHTGTPAQHGLNVIKEPVETCGKMPVVTLELKVPH